MREKWRLDWLAQSSWEKESFSDNKESRVTALPQHHGPAWNHGCVTGWAAGADSCLVLVGLGHGERVSTNQEKPLRSLQERFRVGRARRKCWHSTFTPERGAGLRGLSRSGDWGQVEDVSLEPQTARGHVGERMCSEGTRNILLTPEFRTHFLQSGQTCSPALPVFDSSMYHFLCMRGGQQEGWVGREFISEVDCACGSSDGAGGTTATRTGGREQGLSVAGTTPWAPTFSRGDTQASLSVCESSGLPQVTAEENQMSSLDHVPRP